MMTCILSIRKFSLLYVHLRERNVQEEQVVARHAFDLNETELASCG